MAFDQLSNRMTIVDDENEGLIHRNLSSVLIRFVSYRLPMQKWLDDTSQLPWLDRLGEHGPSAQILKPPSCFPVAPRTRHDHGDCRQGRRSLDLGKKGETVELGHLEIREHQAVLRLAQPA